MKKIRIASLGLAVTLLLSPASTLGHPGKTDSSGGHKNNKNKSGLGNYHYHYGGNPAHLHDNSVCPYSGSSSESTFKSNTKLSSKSSTSAKTSEIKKAQEKLNELGYDCGKADGKTGKNTKAAIKNFKKIMVLKFMVY